MNKKILAFSKGYAVGVLIKIKSEIEKCYYNDSPEVDGVVVMKEDINSLFDKRISELKEGEKHE